jgi:hypothetical protein
MRSRNYNKDRQYNGQKIRTKRQTTIYKKNTHKTKIRATRIHLKPGVNSGAPEGTQILLH